MGDITTGSRKQTFWVAPVTKQSGGLEEQTFYMSDYDHTMPTFYIPMVAAYSLPSGANKESFVEHLRRGLEITLGQYLPLAGKLNIDSTNGRYSIIARHDDVVELGVNYHDDSEDDSFPTFAALEADAFPPMAFDGRKYLPRRMTEKATLTSHGDFADLDDRISMFLITFIRGGFILGLGFHHLATDGHGLSGLMQQWAGNTRALASDQMLPPFDPSIMDRSQLVYKGALPGEERMKELEKRVKFIKQLDAIPAPPPADFKLPATSEVLFHFPKSKLARLKEAAIAKGGDGWVSTYDSLMALCWRCATRARLPAFKNDLSTRSACMHAVNCRPRVDPPIAKHYVGNMAMHGRPEHTFEEILAPDALPRLAAEIRATNIQVNHQLVQETIEYVSGIPDKRHIALNMNAFMGTDVASSSWQGISIGEWQFGFGSSPKALRWPRPQLDGFVFYFPNRKTDDPDQGIELVMCLLETGMERLLTDEEWLEYATVRGPTRFPG